jgi:hypothetical protein
VTGEDKVDALARLRAGDHDDRRAISTAHALVVATPLRQDLPHE